MKTNRNHNRHGITLLFVISMIVLFLLMGTTFVVVANSFMRSAVQRSRFEFANPGDESGQRFISEALYNLVRGPALDDLNSPLRGHSLLGDMYGYGLEAHVKALDAVLIERPNDDGIPPGMPSDTPPQFFRMETIGLDTNGLKREEDNNRYVIAKRILRNSQSDHGALLSDPFDGWDVNGNVPLNAAPGRFNGLLLTFVSDGAAGLTARIIDHQVFTVEDSSDIVTDSPVMHRHVLVCQLLNSTPKISTGNLVDHVVQWENPNPALGTSLGTAVVDRFNPTRVIINGRPFAGTGTGRFDPAREPGMAALRTWRDDSFSPPIVYNPTLLPNYRGEGYDPDATPPHDRFVGQHLGFYNKDATDTNDLIPGNSSAENESYDAFDFQNMFLAGIFHQYISDGLDNDNDMETDEADEGIVPSFHRRELARFDSSGGIYQRLRYSFRPEYLLSQDMMTPDSRSTATINFPNLIDPGLDPNDPSDDSVYSFGRRPMDVDNDNDGMADGNWMDIGLSPISIGNGRLAKPLVSYHVTDLDSRINVNTHGNNSQIASNTRFMRMTWPMLADTLPGLGANLQPIQGMGFGPAEVDIRQVFSDAEVERLLVGEIPFENNVTIPGRYGFGENDTRRDRGGGPVPGLGNLDSPLFGQDVFSAYKFFGYPNYGEVMPVGSPHSVVGGFFQSSPMDIYGRFRTDYPVFGDITGMPVIDLRTTTLLNSEIINNPYETNFSPTPAAGQHDTLFSLLELERILRQFDYDVAGLPDRLATLAPSLLSSGMNRSVVTTDSWEVPTQFSSVVNGGLETLTGKLYQILSRPNASNGQNSIGIPLPVTSSSEVIDRDRQILANITGFSHELNAGNPTGKFLLDQSRESYLSADVRSGRPFDVNRPFGNGRDDDTDGVIDESDEYDVSSGVVESLPHPGGGQFSIDHNNDSAPSRGPLEGDKARQRFARDLYMLVLLTCEVVDRDGDGNLFDPSLDQFDSGDFSFPDADGNPLPNSMERQRFREVIAQWAINVAEFRDTDSIMTPFEVDINPFNGWDVDGDITTDEGSVRRVVWGTERPELLLTEVIAMHDRRTQDRADDNGSMESHDNGMGMDPHFDNRQVPQASAFFELYHPWISSPGNQILPGEFASSPGVQDLDLTKLSPNGAPVWRILALNHNSLTASPISLNAPQTFDPTMDPDILDSVNGQQIPPNSIRRIIYFNQPDAALTGTEFTGNLVYHPVDQVLSGPVMLEPGGYAVVGSAGEEDNDTYTTVLGRRDLEVDDLPIDLDGTRRIELDAGASPPEVRVYHSADLMNPDIAEAQVLPIVGPVSNPTRSLGLSDPTSGYSNPSIANMAEGEGRLFVDPVDMTTPIALDEPADRADEDYPNFYNNILGKDQLRGDVYMILLQRLANPNAVYNADTNPYRTVDSSACDLFCFNGVDKRGETDMAVTGGANPEPVYFGTYERRSEIENPAMAGGETVNPDGTGRYRLLWKSEFTGLNPTMPSTDAAPVDPDDVHAFPKDLIHSLGQLNQTFVSPAGQTPVSPFAWLQWNNRPFVSALELANVPFTSSYFLTHRFDVSQRNVNPMWNVFDPVAQMENRSLEFAGEFPHLLNFHADVDNLPAMQKLFDYVEVPSRYSGTETYLNPDRFANTNPPISENDPLRHSFTTAFAPPFDYVSNFRNPGKININTITDHRVWNATMGAYATNLPDANSNGVQDEQFISWFSQAPFNPYRSANAGNWVPSLQNPSEPNALVLKQADAGLFRRTIDLSGGWPFTGMPMFDGTTPFFDYVPYDFAPAADNIPDPLQNANRNAFFRYNKRNRLGNIATNRSSMFAIWITVGYFEIEPHDTLENGEPKRVEALGAEIKDEFDQSTRHRGYFIFDRSIPVAFEPGKNHNVERAIRVSRYIE